jgi:phospho-N-acetylmuramoyl-pentapeptide-transferase
MLYHIFYQLLSEKYHSLNVFKYQTFRAIASFLFSFIFVLIVEPIFIARLKNRGVKGQPIRVDGPEAHKTTKQGTPTMGGVVIVFSVILSTLLFCDLTNKYVWLVVSILSAYAYLGYIDDWKKITKQDNYNGLSEKQKLVWQFAIAGIVVGVMVVTDFPSYITIPFFKDVVISPMPLFVLFAMLVIVGTSNAVNLTDGLDGLAIGPVMSVAATYAIFAYVLGHVEITKYLNFVYIHGAGEISIILASLFAGGLGFLWYNTFPAQVFMGDTGALALGGALGLVAVIVKQEFVLVIAGGIFVVEALSVIIQRYYYKLTKKRIFKMAPIHHHFELKGWAEPKIIVRFWIISIVLALVALSTLKLR